MGEKETVLELMEKHTKTQLIELAERRGVTFSEQGTKTEIATEIVEAAAKEDAPVEDEPRILEEEIAEAAEEVEAAVLEDVAEEVATETCTTATTTDVVSEAVEESAPVATPAVDEEMDAAKAAVASAIAAYNLASKGGTRPALKEREAKTAAKRALAAIINARNT